MGPRLTRLANGLSEKWENLNHLASQFEQRQFVLLTLMETWHILRARKLICPVKSGPNLYFTGYLLTCRAVLTFTA